MSKYKWLNKIDYFDNLKPLGKILYKLGIIRYKNQFFSGGYYTGVFKFVLLNPFTWVLITILFSLCLCITLYEALFNAYNEVKDYFRKGLTVELDRQYKSKY